MTGSVSKEQHDAKKRKGIKERFGPEVPLVSIITVVLNAARRLENAILEVRSQTYPNLEYIIIDGGSTDGTLEILLKNDPWIGYWVSEPDHGIYDAMDKGVEASNGKWIYFMGVDDAFYSQDTLASIFLGRTICKSIDLVIGQVYTDRGLITSRFNASLLYKNTVYHQAVFYAHHIFDCFRYCSPPFSSRNKKYYRISGDYRLNLMLYRRGANHLRVDLPVATCQSGVSMEGKMRGYLEEIQIRHEYVKFHKAVFFDVFTILRYLYKQALILKLGKAV